MSELKPLPCPFCGGAPRSVARPDNIDGTRFFYALACYCGGYSACAHKMAVEPTPEQAKRTAIEAWNRRAQPAQAVPPDVVRDADVEAAAKKMAEIFDYPWDFMPEKGRNTMRENVRAVLDAAIAQQKGGV